MSNFFFLSLSIYPSLSSSISTHLPIHLSILHSLPSLSSRHTHFVTTPRHPLSKTTFIPTFRDRLVKTSLRTACPSPAIPDPARQPPSPGRPQSKRGNSPPSLISLQGSCQRHGRLARLLDPIGCPVEREPETRACRFPFGDSPSCL